MAVAREFNVVVTDDLNGAPGAEPRHFGVNGQEYEIDLIDENWNEVLDTLKPYIAAARPVKTGKAAGKRGRRPAASKAEKDENRAARQWAREQGLDVSDRGRIPGHILDKFRASEAALAG